MSKPPTEMIERVARSFCGGLDDKLIQHHRWGDNGLAEPDGDPVPMWTCHINSAIAAIAAMREPTREMIDDGNTVTINAGDIWEPSDGISYSGPSCALECWQAMIDAALEGKL